MRSLISSVSRSRPVRLTIETLGSIVFFYFVCFSFGAPLVDEYEYTLGLSTLLACLCLVPTFVCAAPRHHRDPVALVIRVLAHRDYATRPEELCSVVAHGAAIGAWLGCCVIPLDWDRWWQQYPTPCCFGAIFGTIIAFIYIGFFEKMVKKMKFFKKN